MLTYLNIRDFAIIDTLDVEFSDGMTVLTGETGAGKSIIVDAVSLALGERADASVIRQGAARAEITAQFALHGNSGAVQWLTGQDLLTEDDECIVRRVITAEGRSRGYINDRTVTMQMLQALGEQLVDIHGQHEHQSLMRRPVQLSLLDSYASLDDKLQAVAENCRQWRTQQDRLDELQQAAADRDNHMDLLRFQTQELAALGLGTDEPAALDEEHARLSNAGKLLEAAQTALDSIYENDDTSAQHLLGSASQTLEPLADLDPQLQPVQQALVAALAQVDEAADGLRHYLARLEIDPQRLEWVENRIGSIHQMARKHRVSPAELHDLLEKLTTELAQLEKLEVTLTDLQATVRHQLENYIRSAHELHDLRSKAADELSRKMTGLMQKLGMPGGRFSIAVTFDDKAPPTANGLDRVEFLVSTNPGQVLQPMNKVASGGELSRIALAIQVIAARAAGIPTLVFDEVDAGVSGRVAEIVGRQLHLLGERRQVLCVTHLPQVASLSDQHLLVSKKVSGKKTRTYIKPLDAKAQVEALASMLGGVQITETTRRHAREMIAKARQSG